MRPDGTGGCSEGMKAARSEHQSKGEIDMMTVRKLETMTEAELDSLKRETFRAIFQAAAQDRVFYLADLENIIRRQAEFKQGPS